MKIKAPINYAFIFLALLLFTTAICQAQSLTITHSIPFEEIKEVSIDRKGNIFCSDGQGNITKIGSQGKLLQTFSPQKAGKVSLIEAWSTLRVFVFYQESQEYLFLDRFMTSDNRYELNHNALGLIGMATISNDNGLWLIDISDYSLKKLNMNFNQVTLSISLNTLPISKKLKVNYMREYQNMLFINDSNIGILVFDTFGNYLKTLPFKDLVYFNFLGEELYFIKQNTLHFFHLYNLKERKVKVPGDKIYSQALIANNRAYLIAGSGIDIARLTSN